MGLLNLPDLPTDLFLIVTRYLDTIDIVRCRLVSKSWHREFTDESFLREVLVREYGGSRDVRALSELELKCMVPSGSDSGEFQVIWRRTFDRVIARKRALKSGRPQRVTKRHLHCGPMTLLEKQSSSQSRIIPVYSWGRYLRMADRHSRRGVNVLLEGQVPTDLLETEWTYDSGLLVYLDMIDVPAYVLLDIEQDTIAVVPFDMKDRIVRRVRLKHNLLVFEWAEKEPYHKLNELEEVHHHYVTAFDVRSTEYCFPWLSQWQFTFRSEWKMHYLGFPLSAQDCWISDHSTTHYAVYIWQTNRSAWGENEPIESFFIWDISQPSNCRPSGEPSSCSQGSVEPRLVKKLSYLDLDHLTIRQKDTPFLRKIALDGSACVYFLEEGCNRERGSHVGHGYEAGRRNPRDVVWERVVGIPVLGAGPIWEDRLGLDSTVMWQHPNFESPDPFMPERATCWRYKGMGAGIRNQVVQDKSAGIMFSVVQRTIGYPQVWVSSDSRSWTAEIGLQDVEWRWKQIHGDERYLIIQSDEELYVLHFDRDLGAGMKTGKPSLRMAS